MYVVSHAVCFSLPIISRQTAVSQFDYEPYEAACRGMSLVQRSNIKMFAVHSTELTTNEKVLEFHDSMRVLQIKLRKQGVELLDYAFCTHRSHIPCYCRLPNPGLPLRLALKHEIIPSNLWVIGTKDQVAGLDTSAAIKTLAVGMSLSLQDACAIVCAGTV